jgi:hypothetical protein
MNLLQKIKDRFDKEPPIYFCMPPIDYTEERRIERLARIQEMKEAIVLAWKEINNK